MHGRACMFAYKVFQKGSLPSFPNEFALSYRSAPEMRVVNPAPPPTPEPGAAWPEFKYIQVINEVKYSWASPEANVEVGRSGLFSRTYNSHNFIGLRTDPI